MVTVTVVLSSDKYDSGVTTIVDDAGCGAWGLRGEMVVGRSLASSRRAETWELVLNVLL